MHIPLIFMDFFILIVSDITKNNLLIGTHKTHMEEGGIKKEIMGQIETSCKIFKIS